MKKGVLVISILLFFFDSNAQSSWQWGKRGGSSDVDGTGGGESVQDMATDRQGNVYVLSTMMQTGANVDGHAVAEWGGVDISISSFKCDGTYRWSKTIGTSGDDAGMMTLGTDAVGAVYVTGFLIPHFITAHIDADSAWFTGTSYKTFFIAKFDTAGAYKWFRMPQPDTVGSTTLSVCGSFDMDVDSAGNVYVLCELPRGIYGGSYVVTDTSGVFILKYDRFGNFVSGTQLQISIFHTYHGGTPRLRMKRDHQSGRYYVTGNLLYGGEAMTFGSTPITHSMYVGCFNSAGTLLWQRQDTDGILYGSSFGRPAVDEQHNIYLGGRASNADTFNSYVMINGGSSAVPVIYKLDTNGNNIWAKNATVNGATDCSAVILNGNEVVLAGQYPGLLKWPGYPDSLHIAFGPGGYRIFVTRFDASTGAVLGLDSIGSDPSVYNWATSLTSDKFGNFYVGGGFEDHLYFQGLTLPGDTIYIAGGVSDFFVAKYGTSNCSTVIATLSTPSSFPEGEELKIYPNPAANELIIENGSSGTHIMLYDLLGQSIYCGMVSSSKEIINTKNLPAGTYVLQLADTNGNRTTRKIIKQ